MKKKMKNDFMPKFLEPKEINLEESGTYILRKKYENEILELVKETLKRNKL